MNSVQPTTQRTIPLPVVVSPVYPGTPIAGGESVIVSQPVPRDALVQGGRLDNDELAKRLVRLGKDLAEKLTVKLPSADDVRSTLTGIFGPNLVESFDAIINYVKAKKNPELGQVPKNTKLPLVQMLEQLQGDLDVDLSQAVKLMKLLAVDAEPPQKEAVRGLIVDANPRCLENGFGSVMKALAENRVEMPKTKREALRGIIRELQTEWEASAPMVRQKLPTVLRLAIPAEGDVGEVIRMSHLKKLVDHPWVVRHQLGSTVQDTLQHRTSDLADTEQKLMGALTTLFSQFAAVHPSMRSIGMDPASLVEDPIVKAWVDDACKNQYRLRICDNYSDPQEQPIRKTIDEINALTKVNPRYPTLLQETLQAIPSSAVKLAPSEWLQTLSFVNSLGLDPGDLVKKTLPDLKKLRDHMTKNWETVLPAKQYDLIRKDFDVVMRDLAKFDTIQETTPFEEAVRFVLKRYHHFKVDEIREKEDLPTVSLRDKTVGEVKKAGPVVFSQAVAETRIDALLQTRKEDVLHALILEGGAGTLMDKSGKLAELERYLDDIEELSKPEHQDVLSRVQRSGQANPDERAPLVQISSSLIRLGYKNALIEGLDQILDSQEAHRANAGVPVLKVSHLSKMSIKEFALSCGVTPEEFDKIPEAKPWDDKYWGALVKAVRDFGKRQDNATTKMDTTAAFKALCKAFLMGQYQEFLETPGTPWGDANLKAAEDFKAHGLDMQKWWSCEDEETVTLPGKKRITLKFEKPGPQSLFYSSYSGACSAFGSMNEYQRFVTAAHKSFREVVMIEADTGKPMGKATLHWILDTKTNQPILAANSGEFRGQYCDASSEPITWGLGRLMSRIGKVTRGGTLKIKGQNRSVKGGRSVMCVTGTHYNNLEGAMTRFKKNNIEFIGQTANNETYSDLVHGTWVNLHREDGKPHKDIRLDLLWEPLGPRIKSFRFVTRPVVQLFTKAANQIDKWVNG